MGRFSDSLKQKGRFSGSFNQEGSSGSRSGSMVTKCKKRRIWFPNLGRAGSVVPESKEGFIGLKFKIKSTHTTCHVREYKTGLCV